jgi:hypothetical protein
MEVVKIKTQAQAHSMFYSTLFISIALNLLTFLIAVGHAHATSCAGEASIRRPMMVATFETSAQTVHAPNRAPAILPQLPTSHKLKIGRTRAGLIAQIWDNDSCVATCRTAPLERTDDGSPLALQMECRHPSLPLLTTTATLTWGGKAAGKNRSNPPQLRFGTWLQGYHPVKLRTEVDLYTGRTAPRLVAKR